LLTQRDITALLAEIERYRGAQASSVPALIARTRDWLRTVAPTRGVADLLVRDVSALCVYAEMPDVEASRFAAGALALVLDRQDTAAATLIGRHLVASVALHEIRRRRGEPASERLPSISVDDRNRTESLFLSFAERPLHTDPELRAQAQRFCDRLSSLLGAPFVGHLTRGVRRLLDVFGESSRPDAQMWSRAALSYVLQADDAVDDRLGLVGLIDDLHVVDTALGFVDAAVTPIDQVIRQLISAWPFLGEFLA
jgi:hypothetical protein